MSLADTALVFFVATAASCAQTASGFGFSMLLVPPLALALGPKEAVVLANLLSPAQNLFLMTRVHGDVEWRLGTLLFAGAAAGMPVGVAVLILVDAEALKAAIAAAVIVSTALLWRGVRLPRTNRATDAATGFLSGLLNTSTSMSGPPVVLYLAGRKLGSAAFRGTLTAYFLASGLVAIALFAATGRLDRDVLALGGVALPGILLGLAVGVRLYRRLDERQFRAAVVVVLFASGFIALGTVFV